jgi:hypothetical protein
MLPTAAAAAAAALALAFIFIIGGGGGQKGWRMRRLGQSRAGVVRSSEVAIAAMV